MKSQESDARVRRVLLEKKRLTARFAKVLKTAAQYRIVRDLVCRGVDHRHLPSIARIKILTEKLDEYRAVYFHLCDVQLLDNSALFVVPFWWRRPVKTEVTYHRNGALVAIDLTSESFFVPAPEIMDLYDVSAFYAEDVDEQKTGIRYYNESAKDERILTDGPTQDREVDVDRS